MTEIEMQGLESIRSFAEVVQPKQIPIGSTVKITLYGIDEIVNKIGIVVGCFCPNKTGYE